MIAAPVGWPLVWLAAALALGLGAPWWLKALLCVPAVLWAPGAGWARWLNPRASRLQEVIDAAWLSVVFAVVNVALTRLTGGGAWTLMGLSLAWMVAGLAMGRRGPNPPPPSDRTRLGLVAVVALLAVAGWTRRGDLTRPLDAYWYHEVANGEHLDNAGWAAGEGWGPAQPFGWEQAGAARLTDPELDGGSLRFEGRAMLLLRGPVGATLSAGAASATIQRDVVEREQPEAVPRYLERGVASLALDAGEHDIAITGADAESLIYVLPGSEAIWEAHGLGEVRLFHYYQLLNIVENQRWAAELLDDRALTVNQPPLWSNVLALSAALVDPGLRGAGALLMWVLLLLGISGVRLLEVTAPRAPWAAWLLPGAYACVHLKLMAEPASMNFPDSLYAAAFPAGLTAMALSAQRDEGAPRFGLLALLAGLTRYPGTIALTLAAGLHGLLWRRFPKRELKAAWGLVAAVGAALAVAALLSGQFRDWLFILWFETVPEHWQNAGEPLPLHMRPAAFYLTWLKYSGGGLLLAIAAATVGSRAGRWIVGSALTYSLFLCTIDHFSTHYFLPLLALTAAGLGASAAGLRWRWLGEAMCAAALLGALWFFGWGTCDVMLGH